MKFVIVFAAFLAIASAALLPSSARTADQEAYTVSKQASIAPDQSQYTYAIETSNGISQSETGTLNQARSADASPAYATRGEFSWTAPDGQKFTLKYIADENGFQPEAAHLPVAPVA